ncbi:MAG: S24 family peptidase [Mixta calida]|uniref:S24 family peptidase n=1 Tax=Mixta calida TaxID=665913 RepID=UPI0029154638|nr:S24 family peptidase [Mixta calida]MDU4943869.1 S24 family peptidase [Mixta calida]
METKDIRRSNLRTLLDEYTSQGLTKAEFAEKLGITASQLSQVTSLKHVRNIGDVLARRTEVSFGLPKGWMDNLHAESVDKAHKSAPAGNYNLQNLSGNYTDHTYRIEQLDVELSCGGGRMNSDYPDIIQSIEIDPEYAKRMFGGRPASSLKITTAVGDSMRGSVEPGELVVLDVTVSRFVSDGIYAFSYGDSAHIKRLQRLKDRLIVISDNKTYEKWEIGPEEEDQLHIQGFVVGKWEMNYTRLG